MRTDAREPRLAIFFSCFGLLFLFLFKVVWWILDVFLGVLKKKNGLKFLQKEKQSWAARNLGVYLWGLSRFGLCLCLFEKYTSFGVGLGGFMCIWKDPLQAVEYSCVSDLLEVYCSRSQVFDRFWTHRSLNIPVAPTAPFRSRSTHRIQPAAAQHLPLKARTHSTGSKPEEVYAEDVC